MDGEPIRVLAVDDDPAMVSLTADALERETAHLSVETVTDPREALAMLADGATVDCVVSDYDMPEMTGVELLAAVREERPDLPFVLFTGKGSEEVASEAIEAGVTSYLQKATGASQYAMLANRIENAVAQFRAERATDRVEQRYQRLIEESSDVVAIVDADGTYEYVGGSAERVLGYAPTELVGTSGFAYVHPEDRQAVAAQLRDLIDRPGGRTALEFRFRRPNGEWVWVEATARNLLEDPYVDGIVTSVREITARRERTRELERNAELVEALSTALPSYAFVYDREGTYLDVVTGLRRGTTGYTGAELVGRPVEAVLDDEPADRIRAAIETCLETGDPAELEYRVAGDDGERWYEATVVPLAGGYADADEAVLVSAHDVTARQTRERRLERFASALSHDLRTPLQIAQGHLELAREEPGSGHLETVADAHGRMAELIDDMLALALDEAEIDETEPVALDELVRDCWAAVGSEAATLNVETDRSVPADRSRLRQLFGNLLGNAVEHGGEVTVTVGALPDGFFLADDGPGIPAAERERVFEFGHSTDEGGTGVGLAVTREIAEAHDWTITVTESADGGARFEITGVDA